MSKQQQSMWSSVHADYLDQLYDRGLSQIEMSAAMSKQFKFRVTVAHINLLLRKMRSPGNELFRNTPYRTAPRFRY